MGTSKFIFPHPPERVEVKVKFCTIFTWGNCIERNSATGKYSCFDLDRHTKTSVTNLKVIEPFCSA